MKKGFFMAGASLLLMIAKAEASDTQLLIEKFDSLNQYTSVKEFETKYPSKDLLLDYIKGSSDRDSFIKTVKEKESLNNVCFGKYTEPQKNSKQPLDENEEATELFTKLFEMHTQKISQRPPAKPEA